MKQQLIAIAAYTVAVLAANLAASTFIPLPIFGMVSVGTLIFGATFTIRDYAHYLGRSTIYAMIAIAAVVNLAVALLIDVPLRIIAASFLAIVIAETVDTEVYQRFIARPWLQRVAISNVFSVPLDTALFLMVAFGGVLSWDVLIALFVGEVAVKSVIALGLAMKRGMQ